MRNFRDYLEVVTEASLTKKKAIEDLEKDLKEQIEEGEIDPKKEYIWINDFRGDNKNYKNKMWKILEKHEIWGLSYSPKWYEGSINQTKEQQQKSFKEKIKTLATNTIEEYKVPLQSGNSSVVLSIFKGTYSDLLNAIN